MPAIFIVRPCEGLLIDFQNCPTRSGKPGDRSGRRALGTLYVLAYKQPLMASCGHEEAMLETVLSVSVSTRRARVAEYRLTLAHTLE